MSVLVATSRPAELAEFINALGAETGQDIDVTSSGAVTLEQVKAAVPSLVVVDEGLEDFTPLKLVVEIMMISAMTNTAVVTSMTDKEFHDASEGYGVLKALPVKPGRTDGVELATLLSTM